MNFEGDEDEEEWIPLVQDDQNNEPLAQHKGPDHDVNPLHSNQNGASRSETAHHKTNNTGRSETDGSARLLRIQNKLQDRISIQTQLLHRPLDYFWQRCLINLLRQIWKLEIRIQVGILLLATGLLMRVFLWSTWYLFYPRFAIVSSTFIVSLLYLDPFDIHNQLKGTWSMVEALFSPSSSQQGKVVEGIDTNKLRSLSLVLFMITSILEIRTLSFLSRINAGLVLTNAADTNSNNGWTTVSLYCYNIGVAVCISSSMLFMCWARRLRPCYISYRGLLILYGFSLLVTIVSYERNANNVRQVPALAAPFLTSTATLLLMYKDDSYEWLSRITRQAFRLSLRDVFCMVSETVTDDDMLQLAILRWICDFWASSSVPIEPERKGSPKDHGTASSSRTSFRSGSKMEQDPCSLTNTSRASGTSSEAPAFRHDSIRWEELQPMLNIEIDHMETEIDALRTKTTHSSHGDAMNHSMPQQDNRKESYPQKPTPSMNQEIDHPLVGLKSMLLSFDVDDRARPAVLAFRRAVESFPPKKKTAVAISVLRRCPALLTVMFHTLFLSDVHSLIVTSLVLCPFVVVEYYRISEWMKTCQHIRSNSSKKMEREEEENDWRIPASLKNVDTMTILLSGDENAVFRPPSLLIVWFNIVSSVSALEVGLSTARCVETTAIAIEFAGSAMSLVKFGFEISENGILHGVMVLAEEVLSIYGKGRDIGNLYISGDKSAQYTSAAIRAVHHGQKFVNNIRTISEDENVVSFAQPFLNFLSMLTGGKGEEIHDDISTFPDVDHELHSDDINLQEEENTIDSKAKVDSNNGEEKLSTMTTYSEGVSNPGKPEGATPMPLVQFDSVSKLSAPDEDLSEVMEMIATSYEQELIDQNEKDDLFKKLSELQVEELRDPSVLSAMKRTLTIILENGSMIPIIDHSGSSNVIDQQSRSSSLDPILTDDSALSVQDIDISSSNEIKRASVVDDQKKEFQVSQSTKQNNDIITLGVAALGVVASGVALTVKSGSKTSDHRQYYVATEDEISEIITSEHESNRERLSTVEIVELADHNTEGEWVALGDGNL